MLDNLATSLADTLQGIPVLSLLIILPLIGALAAFFLGKNAKLAKGICLLLSFITLIISVLVMTPTMAQETAASCLPKTMFG